MTAGFVNFDLKAIVHINLMDEKGESHETEVFVDTGSNGNLSLPYTLLQKVNASFLEDTSVQLADGNSVTFSVYAASILWEGKIRTVEIFATSGDPLLGMRLLQGSKLTIHVTDGGAVNIEPIQ